MSGGHDNEHDSVGRGANDDRRSTPTDSAVSGEGHRTADIHAGGQGAVALIPVQPLWTGDLFAGLDAELIGLLGGLDRAQWQLPTSAGRWRVRDVAAHLLDTAIRRLSSVRDHYHPPPPDPPPANNDELVAYLDAMNAQWVDAAQRISPPLLVELLELVGSRLCAALERLDPHGTAQFPVAWAGEERSENWMDIGREYTERWHHQDQMREAVGAPALDEAKWLRPVVDISMRGLPHAYRSIRPPKNTSVVFDIAGDGGGRWTLLREDDAWRLYTGEVESPTCRVTVDALDAARILLHRMPREEALHRVWIEGDRDLGERFLDSRSVMVRDPLDQQ